MKFKTDENIPVESAEELRRAGHDVATVFDQKLAGHADSRIADVCRAEARSLLTLDLDFADIRAYPPENYTGIIVLRPAVQTLTNIRRLVGQVVNLLLSEEPTGQLWIVDEGQIRVRGKSTEGT